MLWRYVNDVTQLSINKERYWLTLTLLPVLQIFFKSGGPKWPMEQKMGGHFLKWWAQTYKTKHNWNLGSILDTYIIYVYSLLFCKEEPIFFLFPNVHSIFKIHLLHTWPTDAYPHQMVTCYCRNACPSLTCNIILHTEPERAFSVATESEGAFSVVTESEGAFSGVTESECVVPVAPETEW